MATPSPEIIETVDEQLELSEGPPFRVIIHNDNVTPMDFVVYVLLNVFLLAGPRALQVMYTAHYQGSAYVQTLPEGEAQRRVHRAHFMARMQGFPLHFSLEKE